MPILNTKLGKIKGIERDIAYQYLGIEYARAEKRYEYAKLNGGWEGVLDATEWGPSCVQKREYYPHYEIPNRMFYFKESRENVPFTYSEHCQVLNIWTPKKEGKYPVMIWIHGGGFDSGCSHDPQFDGAHLANHGVVVVSINYRVGPFGYICHEEIERENGHDGNFGLHDQLLALKWVHQNIENFMGDNENITLFGQSAGAMSVQYLAAMAEAKGLFKRAIMMSGAGVTPPVMDMMSNVAQRDFTKELMELTNSKDFEDFRNKDYQTLYDAIEILGKKYGNLIPYMMPVFDNFFFSDNSIEDIVKNAADIDYIVGYTSKDIFTSKFCTAALDFAQMKNGYSYLFDIAAPGDNAKAFHSADLRYAFGTLEASWRPYRMWDYEVSFMMMKYFTNFAKTGNPNDGILPLWKKENGKSLVFGESKVEMGKPDMKVLEENEKITTI